MGSISVKVL